MTKMNITFSVGNGLPNNGLTFQLLVDGHFVMFMVYVF